MGLGAFAKRLIPEGDLLHLNTTYTTVCIMSRTYRNQPTYIFRPVQTYSELKQQYFDDDGYTVSSRHRYVPTNYDDISISAYKQLDHHHK